jgi:ribulose-phosphate 3-epimerase
MNLPARPCIAPSILSSDFSRLGVEVRAVEKAGADWLHVDVMDGHFVPNLTIGPDVVAAVRRHSRLPLDVHLMVERPESCISAFVKAGASVVTVHAEACVHLHRTVQQIRELGSAAGVALNPATPLEVLEHLLTDIDLVLIMTVNPGFGGQRPIASAIRKLGLLRDRLSRLEESSRPALEVDGGVKVENAGEFSDADVLVSGSGIFLWPEREGHPKEALEEEGLAAQYRKAISKLREEGTRAGFHAKA